MPLAKLQATVRFAKSIPIVDLQGEMNAYAEESVLKSAYTEATRAGAKTVALNFGGAGYINSKGIALIVGLMSLARREGTRLIAFGVSDHYKEIFEITRLTDYMPIFANETAALESSK